jgi:hypothetical protein
MLTGVRISGTPYQSGLLQIRYYASRMLSVKKVHNQGRPFENQDDNSTGKNTCQASNALVVRLIDKHGILVDNGFTQGTVVSKGVEVPRW